MKNLSRIFILIITAGCSLLAQPLSISTESLTSKDGLSQNSVVKILQDHRRFLWLGTFDGINRFDGYSFKVYKTTPSDSTSLSGQHFQAMCEDKYGNLWFGSLGGGLNKYNRSTDSFKRYISDPKKQNSIISDYVRDLIFDENGNLWIATESGLDRFDPVKEKFTHFRNNYQDANSILTDYVTSLGKDAKGNIWIGSGYGVDRYDAKGNKFVHYLRTISTNGNIILDNANTLWFGSTLGLYKYDEASDKMILYQNQNFNSTNQSIRVILEDSHGNFWVCPTRGGLFRFDKKTGRFTQYVDNPNNKINLGKAVVYSLLEDNFGILWIGTAGGGVTKLDFRKLQFNNYTFMPGIEKSLSNNNVYGIAEDKNGILWINTYGGGINRFDPGLKSNSFTRFVHDNKNPNSLNDNLTYCLLIDKNELLWIGTQSGLEYFDIKTKTFIHPQGYPVIETSTAAPVAIFTITQSSSGEIYIGTYSQGLYVFNPKNKSLKNFVYDPNVPNGISNSTVRRIFEDKKGNIWIGTDHGLNLFDRRKNEFIKFQNDPNDSTSLSSNNAFSLYEDKIGNFWVGTTLGLNKMIWKNGDVKNVKFIRYSKEDGLPDNNIQGILEDKEGKLWLSTNRGLSKFDVSKELFINYNEDNGLLSDEFYLNSFFQRKTGEMIFGGNQGFTIFNPDEIKNDTNIPPVVLTDFTIFNKPVQIGKEIDGLVVLDNAITETNSITLSYKHSVVTFAFAALHYSSPKNNKYAYYLEGLESGWNYVDNRKFATYANLAPGNYILRIKASNNSGVWNVKGLSLKITVIPPFWQTWLFRLSAAAVIILLFVFTYKRRIRTIEERKVELEKLNDQLILENIERQRSEEMVKEYAEELKQSNQTKDKFFSIIAHDLKNPFFILMGFSELILSEYDELTDEERRFYVEQIKKSAQLSHQLLQNLLQWSRSQMGRIEFNPQVIELKISVAENMEFVKTLADNKTISMSCSIDDTVKVKADVDMFNTILRNLLTNSIKYSHKEGLINISAELKDDFAEVCVADTGIGMSDKVKSNLFKLDVHQSSEGTASEPGTGLGLLLCKEFVERHGGEIRAESEENNGSKFYFTLPLAN